MRQNHYEPYTYDSNHEAKRIDIRDKDASEDGKSSKVDE